jgi:hypothetical protein
VDTQGRWPDLDTLRRVEGAASGILVEGAFNVNSVSVNAWKALFGSLRHVETPDGYPLPRFASTLGTDHPVTEDVDLGLRVLTEDQVDRLARAMVTEVKKRGPFLSMADFLNRRRVSGELGEKGALQAAIDNSGINEDVLTSLGEDTDPGPSDSEFYRRLTQDDEFDLARLPQNTAMGAPGVVMQQDLVQTFAPFFTVRSDTFVIRSYGESPSGARAWIESIVQRMPEYLDGGEAAWTDPEDLGPVNQLLGRRFHIVSSRWLREEDL